MRQRRADRLNLLPSAFFHYPAPIKLEQGGPSPPSGACRIMGELLSASAAGDACRSIGRPTDGVMVRFNTWIAGLGLRRVRESWLQSPGSDFSPDLWNGRGTVGAWVGLVGQLFRRGYYGRQEGNTANPQSRKSRSNVKAPSSASWRITAKLTASTRLSRLSANRRRSASPASTS